MSDHTSCSDCRKVFKVAGIVKHQSSCPAYAAQEERRLARWRTQTPVFVPFGFKRRRTEIMDDGAENEQPQVCAIELPAVILY